jgi:YD repeat-containing protein
VFIYKKPKTKDCEPRYLQAKWEYDSLSNLTEWIIFDDDSLIKLKKNYFYDEQNKFIKQIDSMGWGLTTPYGEQIITYKYTDTGKIVTEIHNRNKDTMDYTNTYYYNNDDKIVKYCHSNASKEDCAEYFYFYENNRLTKETANYTSGNTYLTTYSYNKNGLLTEKRTVKDDKTIKLIRYYYE